MKKDIHPEIKECNVTCACGATFTTKSTVDKMNLEVCSECHPFYTGVAGKVRKAGKIEKFNIKHGLKNEDK